MRWRPTRWRTTVAGILMLSVVACTNNDGVIFHGARYSGDGRILTLASLMPACSCMTVTSRHPADDILLVSRLQGMERGRLVLKPGRTARFRVDWAGLGTRDHYDIAAYAYKDGVLGDGLAPLDAHIAL